MRTFERNSCVVTLSGAPPLMANSSLPPVASLTFLRTTASKNLPKMLLLPVNFFALTTKLKTAAEMPPVALTLVTIPCATRGS